MPFRLSGAMRLASNAALGLLAALACLAPPPARAADPDALWRIVHGLCTPNMRAAGDPAPCSAVDLQGGYAVLKDIRGATQLLLIPTDRITGIESPSLLTPGSPNYWRAAWGAWSLFERRAGRQVPREDLGLAINSIYGRSQNQLHIHIDCVRPDVRAALQANAPGLSRRWTTLNVSLAGHRYLARRVMGTELDGNDPFKLLATGVPGARANMGAETLAVIGAVFAGGKPGFVLLADRADPTAGDNGSAEELLDHACAVLGAPPRAAGDAMPSAPG